MSTRFCAAWKIYFWCYVVFAVWGLMFHSFWQGAFQLLGAFGLYGFVWRVRIVNPVFWQIYLILVVIQLGFAGLQWLDPAVQGMVASRPRLFSAALALIVVTEGPLYFALIRYAATTHKIWRASADVQQD